MIRASSPFIRKIRRQIALAQRELVASRSESCAEDALTRINRALSLVSEVSSVDDARAGIRAVTPVTFQPVDPQPALELSPGTVLDCAKSLFGALEQMHQTVAVVFGYIQRHGIFVHVGCSSMKEYAAQHLGVRTEALFDKLSRAGKTAWDAFPGECLQIMALASEGEPPFGGHYPSLPATSTLATLGTVLKWAPDRDQVIARVKSGEWKERKLKQLQAEHAKATKIAASCEKSENAPATKGDARVATEHQCSASPAQPLANSVDDDEPVVRRVTRRAISAVETATEALNGINAGHAPGDLMDVLRDRVADLANVLVRHTAAAGGGGRPRTFVWGQNHP